MESKASHRHKKRSKHTRSATFSSSSVQDSNFKSIVLPEEFIIEILLRLPVKSLLKYRSVSKSWLNLITSPEFIKTHLSITANNKDFTHHRLMLRLNEPKYYLKDCSLSTFLYDHSVTRPFDLDYPMKNSSSFAAIVGSVNGLICLHIEEKDFVIWNPSIRKFKKLPDFLGTNHVHYMYGFGYDELADDYKVVIGLRNLSPNNSYDYIEVQMYSLNSDSWRIIDHILSEIVALNTGLFVNGKLHWVSKTSPDLHYNDWDIISIDLADGKWGKVDKPRYEEGDPNFTPYLVVFGNDLSIHCEHPKTFGNNLWVMKTYGVKESWTKISNINVRYPDSAPFCMSNNGDVLINFGRYFVVYNPKDNSITYPKVPIYMVSYERKIYIESLVWPISAQGTKDATTNQD